MVTAGLKPATSGFQVRRPPQKLKPIFTRTFDQRVEVVIALFVLVVFTVTTLVLLFHLSITNQRVDGVAALEELALPAGSLLSSEDLCNQLE